MTFYTEALKDESLINTMLPQLLKDEVNRIVSSNLTTAGQLNSMLKTAATQTDIVTLYNQLRYVVLPGDFEKVAKTYAVVELETADEKECVECQSENDEVECEECETDNLPVLVESVNKHLEPIMYRLGSKGNHTAAYLVECAMRKINNLRS